MAQVADFPLQLGLAYILLISYLMRSLFVCMRLPGAVGVMLSGFMFSFFMQEEIHGSRDHLQELSFFLVLLTAGFEISLPDLNLHLIVMAFVPATFEIIGIAGFSVLFRGSTWIEGTVLGATLFCVGDGLVIPKMLEYGAQFPNHPLPRLVFMWAPLEASYALTLFGILVGLSDPDKDKVHVDLWVLVSSNIFRIVATLSFGALLGASSGYVIMKRQRIDDALHTATNSLSRPLFTGQPVEAFLMIMSVALGAFGIGLHHWDAVKAYGMHCIFQPELLVIVTGAFFASVADPETLSAVEAALAGVWVFGQLVLFSMLGSRTETGNFMAFSSVYPIMLVGLSMRFLGILTAGYLTLPVRQCQCENCKKANKSAIMSESCFFFLCMLPRATIQGALGSIPSARRFFHSESNSEEIVHFIANAAKLYIVVLAVVGSIMLDLAGPRILEHLAKSKAEFTCTAGIVERENQKAAEGWTDKDRRYAHHLDQEAKQIQEALERSRINSAQVSVDDDVTELEARRRAQSRLESGGSISSGTGVSRDLCAEAQCEPCVAGIPEEWPFSGSEDVVGRPRADSRPRAMSSALIETQNPLLPSQNGGRARAQSSFVGARPRGLSDVSNDGGLVQRFRSDVSLSGLARRNSSCSSMSALRSRAQNLHQFESFRPKDIELQAALSEEGDAASGLSGLEDSDVADVATLGVQTGDDGTYL